MADMAFSDHTVIVQPGHMSAHDNTGVVLKRRRLENGPKSVFGGYGFFDMRNVESTNPHSTGPSFSLLRVIDGYETNDYRVMMF